MRLPVGSVGCAQPRTEAAILCARGPAGPPGGGGEGTHLQQKDGADEDAQGHDGPAGRRVVHEASRPRPAVRKTIGHPARHLHDGADGPGRGGACMREPAQQSRSCAGRRRAEKCVVGLHIGSQAYARVLTGQGGLTVLVKGRSTQACPRRHTCTRRPPPRTAAAPHERSPRGIHSRTCRSARLGSQRSAAQRSVRRRSTGARPSDAPTGGAHTGLSSRDGAAAGLAGGRNALEEDGCGGA